MGQYFCMAVIAGGLLGLVSCAGKPTGRAAEALAKAEGYFGEFAKPTGDNEKQWGLSELRVFGRDKDFHVMAAGSPDVTVRTDAPDAFDVAIPCWYGGKTKDGDDVKRQTKLVVSVQYSDSGWQIPKTEFRERDSLSTWRQVFAYLGWTAVAATLLQLGAAMLAAMFTSKGPFYWASAGVVYMSWYISSVMFGSVLAISICVGLSVIGAIIRFVQLSD